MSDWTSWSNTQKNNWISQNIFGHKTRGDIEKFVDNNWMPIPDYCGSWTEGMQLLENLRDHLQVEYRVMFFHSLARLCYLKLDSTDLRGPELHILNSSSYELLWLEPGDIGAAAYDTFQKDSPENLFKPSVQTIEG